MKKMQQLRQHFRAQGREQFKTFIKEFRDLFQDKETTRKEAREIIIEKYKDIVNTFDS